MTTYLELTMTDITNQQLLEYDLEIEQHLKDECSIHCRLCIEEIEIDIEKGLLGNVAEMGIDFSYRNHLAHRQFITYHCMTCVYCIEEMFSQHFSKYPSGWREDIN